MKIALSLLLVAFLTFMAAPAQAEFQGPGAGGGAPKNASTTNVQQARRMPDDSIVTLTGNVVSRLPGSDDKYMFRDASGEIMVEIDHKDFRGQTVTPANTVRITGEVDKDFGRAAEIDVKRLDVLK